MYLVTLRSMMPCRRIAGLCVGRLLDPLLLVGIVMDMKDKETFYVCDSPKEMESTISGNRDLAKTGFREQEPSEQEQKLRKELEREEIFKRRESLQRTPPGLCGMQGNPVVKTNVEGDGYGKPKIECNVQKKPEFNRVRSHSISSMLPERCRTPAGPENNNQTNKDIEVSSMSSSMGEVERPEKRKRLETPPKERIAPGYSQHSVNLEGLTNMLGKVIKRTKELRKIVDASSKTKIEIKKISRDLDMLVDGLSRNFNKFRSEQIGVTESKQKKSVTNTTAQTDGSPNNRSIGVQVNYDDIEFARSKERNKLRKQIMDIMETEIDYQRITGVLDVEWPEDMYKQTHVRLLDSASFTLEGDYAVFVDPREPDLVGTLGELTIRYPEIKALIQKSDGQVDYLINTVVTRVRNGEKTEKTTALYVLPLESIKEGLDDAEDLYKKIKMLKETMQVHPTPKLNFLLNERQNQDYVRKITEYIFYNTALESTIMTTKTIPKVQKKQELKAQVGKIVVKRGDSTYAELLKTVKSQIDITKVGVQVKALRKTAAGDLLLEVKGGVQKAGILKEAIKEKVDREVKLTNNDVIVHILDIDATTTQKEIEEAIRREVGHGGAPTVKIKSMRPTWTGNQVATVLVSKPVANVMIQAKTIKIGWISCRVRERVSVPRCYNCLDFGHKATECEGPNRSDTCMNCGQSGHRAKDCKNGHYCMSCKTDDHRSDTTKCPKFRMLLNAYQRRRFTKEEAGLFEQRKA